MEGVGCDVEVAAVLPVLCRFKRPPIRRVAMVSAWLVAAERVTLVPPRTYGAGPGWLLVDVAVVVLELLLLRFCCCLVTSAVSWVAKSLMRRSARICLSWGSGTPYRLSVYKLVLFLSLNESKLVISNTEHGVLKLFRSIFVCCDVGSRRRF